MTRPGVPLTRSNPRSAARKTHAGHEGFEALAEAGRIPLPPEPAGVFRWWWSHPDEDDFASRQANLQGWQKGVQPAFPDNGVETASVGARLSRMRSRESSEHARSQGIAESGSFQPDADGAWRSALLRHAHLFE